MRLRLPKRNWKQLKFQHVLKMNILLIWIGIYSNALGGVRLLVPESYAEEAKELLAQDFSKEVEQQFGVSESCPHCGSTDIQPYTEGKRPAYVIFLLLGFPLFSYKNGTKCRQCQHFWS